MRKGVRPRLVLCKDQAPRTVTTVPGSHQVSLFNKPSANWGYFLLKKW